MYDVVWVFSGVVFIEGLFDGDKQCLIIGGKQQVVGIGWQCLVFFQCVVVGVKVDDFVGFML